MKREEEEKGLKVFFKQSVKYNIILCAGYIYMTYLMNSPVSVRPYYCVQYLLFSYLLVKHCSFIHRLMIQSRPAEERMCYKKELETI